MRKFISILLLSTISIGIIYYCIAYINTEKTILEFEQQVRNIGGETSPNAYTQEDYNALPKPVKKYFNFVFGGESIPTIHSVEYEMQGKFRRPWTDYFEDTVAFQVDAVYSSSFMFSATTPIIAFILARPYDAFIDNMMEMKAKIGYILTVVDETWNESLNEISVRRWLMGTPLFPQSLLPWGRVTWEAIDDTHARAVARSRDIKASALVTFREDWSIESFSAEEDGDLDTPYHGSWEYTLKENYQKVNWIMIPMEYMFARKVGSNIYPFWKGKIIEISYN